MRGMGMCIGGALLASAVSALAQTVSAISPTMPMTVVVDDYGRVKPAAPSDRPVEIVGQPATGAPQSPCPGTVSMPTDVAKALVLRVATEEGFHPEFVQSVAKVESRYVSTALSQKGAYGLMQLTPDTARRFKVDLCDPEANVRGGVRFLRALQERYRNPIFILAAYNAGEDAIQKSRGVPPYPETVRFVADVMNDFYAWPDPTGSTLPPTRDSLASAPDLIEPTKNPAPPVAVEAERPAATEWSDGFVMHVQ
ncbi:lytic transglycosylase domain-containing protein [Mesorhizobium silamurunense]|uniref:lytic transglycosylase domain-containing protein n=1 Tax=Mesorhizobium silamurunense TaxID=499528 RepID=UPI001FF042D9|nr:lytic transglycosylase domain-containing protein [Mesorhizobium silamurunense]